MTGWRYNYNTRIFNFLSMKETAFLILTTHLTSSLLLALTCFFWFSFVKWLLFLPKCPFSLAFSSLKADPSRRSPSKLFLTSHHCFLYAYWLYVGLSWVTMKYTPSQSSLISTSCVIHLLFLLFLTHKYFLFLPPTLSTAIAFHFVFPEFC